MNTAIYNIALDIHKTGSQVALSMVRGEKNKRKIVICLTEGGRPYKLTNDITAVFTAKKPDGNFIYNECEVDIENNLIIYNVTSQTTAVMGMVDCQLKLICSDGGLLFSPVFSIVIADTLYNEEPILASSEEFNALTAYVADLQKRLANGEFKGDKGDRGNPGVFIGSGDMPGDCNVQIDPDGDVLNFEDVMPPVDQTYNPKSENAQSGIAVAEAMGFSLIGETVLTEDLQHILFTQGLDGTPLKDYKDFFLFFIGQFTASENSIFLVRANDGLKYFMYRWRTKEVDKDYAFWLLMEEVGVTSNNTTIYKSTFPSSLCGNITNDASLGDGCRIQGLSDATKSVEGTITFSPKQHGVITKFQVDTAETSLFKEGSKFYLFGRKR